MVDYLYAKTTGESFFFFKMAPLDPYDPFKGRYVQLRPVDLDLHYNNQTDRTVYAVITGLYIFDIPVEEYF